MTVILEKPRSCRMSLEVPSSWTQTFPSGRLSVCYPPPILPPSWLRHCGWNQETTCLEPLPSKAFHSVLMGQGAQAAPPSGWIRPPPLWWSLRHIKRVPCAKIALAGSAWQSEIIPGESSFRLRHCALCLQGPCSECTCTPGRVSHPAASSAFPDIVFLSLHKLQQILPNTGLLVGMGTRWRSFDHG